MLTITSYPITQMDSQLHLPVQSKPLGVMWTNGMLTLIVLNDPVLPLANHRIMVRTVGSLVEFDILNVFRFAGVALTGGPTPSADARDGY